MFLTECPFSFAWHVMPPLESLHPHPPEIRVWEYFTSELFYLQRKHLAHEYFVTIFFSREGVVSASPNSQAGGLPLVGCPRLLIQFIRSYPPYRRPFLHPQPEDAPCRGDRDPQTWRHKQHTINILKIIGKPARAASGCLPKHKLKILPLHSSAHWNSDNDNVVRVQGRWKTWVTHSVFKQIRNTWRNFVGTAHFVRFCSSFNITRFRSCKILKYLRIQNVNVTLYQQHLSVRQWFKQFCGRVSFNYY